MTYSAEISRSNPMCFLFLIDQSGSMAERWGVESDKSKAQGVADAINRLLQTLVLRCSKGEYILDRYYIGVIAYGGKLTLGFPSEALAGNLLQPVSLIGNNPLRVEDRVKVKDDGAGGLVEQRIKFQVWFEPKAQGQTPMCAALQLARGVITDFVSQYPNCFPPIVINITDGGATDGQPGPMSDAIRAVASHDGNVLLLNIHISANGEWPILFPTQDGSLPDDFAKLLFSMSSPLPPTMLAQARKELASVEEGARGFAFNADMVSVIRFLDIGTRVG